MIAGLLRYVEIKTKITSIFPFIMGLVFLFYEGQPVRLMATAVFFCGMFLFDLTTTTINNYIDSKTNMQPLPFNRKKSLVIVYLLLISSTGFGLWLVALTDTLVLLLGGICFMGGIFYTYGPLPISRQPWGELFSALFYGLMIPFLLLYINMPEGYYVSLKISLKLIAVRFNLIPLTKVLLLSVNPICCTANIMLANNICDLDKDIKVGRFTLPYYLGEKALRVFECTYYICYLATLAIVLLKVLPPIVLVSVLTIIPVRRNIKLFLSKQVKESSFMTSIYNYIIIMGVFILVIFIGGLMAR